MGHLGKKIDVVTYRETGESVSIFLDTASGQFGAEHMGEIIRNENLATVKEAVHKSLAKNAKLEWVPIIIARQYDPGTWSMYGRDVAFNVVGLAVERRYVAKLNTSDNSHRSVDWDTLPEERIKLAQREHGVVPDLPFHNKEERTHIFAYSETLWKGLNAIKTKIELLEEQLKDLLTVKIKLIENHGALALLVE